MQVTSIYFNYYQAERELQHNPHPECGMNVIPEGISRFPTIPFTAAAFAIDATCNTAYEPNATCEGCTETQPCYLKKKLKLHVEFKGEPNSSVLVRTVDPVGDKVDGLDYYLEESRVSIKDHDNPLKSIRLLGDVEPTRIHFNERGNSYVEDDIGDGIIELTISSADIWRHGIGASWQLWQWEYSIDDGKTWELVDGFFLKGISIHRIFLIKNPPTWPWSGYDEEIREVSGEDASSRWPYIGALEWACKWARGETTEVGIASKIVARLNDGTGERFKYQKAGANNYTSVYHKYFDCGRFIDRLNGKFGRGPNVNCVDCAHMVISLCNALGCNLQPGKIENTEDTNPFELNPLVLIGYKELTDGNQTFAYHQVAYITNPDDETQDHIFDACIKYDPEVYQKVQQMEGAPEDPENLSQQQQHGHPVNFPVGADVFTYGYLPLLAKSLDQKSQIGLQLTKGDKQTFSISALKFQ